MFNGKASCLFELDETYQAFGAHSRYFTNSPPWFSLTDFQSMATHYGNFLTPHFPLGYKDGQLLLGFSHNTPDNTLPIFWFEGRTKPWSPIFIRFDKKY
jgi:hypothetical protein